MADSHENIVPKDGRKKGGMINEESRSLGSLLESVS
jgi:hypothetical protein